MQKWEIKRQKEGKKEKYDKQHEKRKKKVENNFLELEKTNRKHVYSCGRLRNVWNFLSFLQRNEKKKR